MRLDDFNVSSIKTAIVSIIRTWINAITSLCSFCLSDELNSLLNRSSIHARVQNKNFTLNNLKNLVRLLCYCGLKSLSLIPFKCLLIIYQILSLSKWLASHLPFFNHIFKRHSCRKFIYTIESILHLWTNKRKPRTQSRSLCWTRTDLKIKNKWQTKETKVPLWIFQSSCRQFAAPKQMNCNPWNSIQIWTHALFTSICFQKLSGKSIICPLDLNE